MYDVNLLVVFLLGALLWTPGRVIAEESVCSGQSKTIIVQVRGRHLFLCMDGKPESTYLVSLGRGGVGKRAHRDLKTPIGRYPLGIPRHSERFHTFIPIGYPTPDQLKQGYLGQDIGIHGPSPKFKWAGRLNAWFGWTSGCIATGTDREIDEIAAWVRRVHAREICIQ